MRPDEALARLASARVGRLATIRPDGSPHVIPFVFAVEGRTLYWVVDAKPKRTRRLQRLANIEHDPRVEIVADEYDEDWTRLWWVRASGHARVVDEGTPEARHAVELLSAKYAPYRAERPAGAVVAIDLVVARGWSGSRV